jgi:hypothetical protein
MILRIEAPGRVHSQNDNRQVPLGRIRQGA